MPALRERAEDIPTLALELLDKIIKRNGLEINPGLSDEALHALSHYSFPGNVRELENILERAVAFSSHGNTEALLANDLELTATENVVDLTPTNHQLEAVLPEAIPNNLTDYLDQVERNILLRALAQANDNRTAAAKLLGISFRQMRYRLQRLEIN